MHRDKAVLGLFNLNVKKLTGLKPVDNRRETKKGGPRAPDKARGGHGTPWPPRRARSAVHRSAAPCSPTGFPRSTIGAVRLSFRVRNGTGRAPHAIAADRWAALRPPGIRPLFRVPWGPHSEGRTSSSDGRPTGEERSDTHAGRPGAR